MSWDTNSTWWSREKIMITCLMSRPNLKNIKILQNTSLQWKRLEIKEAHQLGDKTESNVSKWPINDKNFTGRCTFSLITPQLWPVNLLHFERPESSTSSYQATSLNPHDHRWPTSFGENHRRTTKITIMLLFTIVPGNVHHQDYQL